MEGAMGKAALVEQKALRLLQILLMMALLGCHRQIDLSAALPPQGPWPTQAEAELSEGLDVAAAASYSAQHNGAALVILRHGKLVYAAGQNGHDLHRSRHLFSGTKSFSCALAAILQRDGQLELDQPAAQVLQEWQADPKKSRITVRQLLNFTSGLQDDQRGLTMDGLRNRQKVPDKYALAATLPAARDPGTQYAYGSQHLMAFGAWVLRRTHREPLDILQERLFTPLEMQFTGWIKDAAGHAALPYGAWTTALQWAKYGELVRQKGQWQGQQVVDAAALEQCFRGSEAMPAYGLSWWLNAPLTTAQVQAAIVPPRIGGDGKRAYGDEAPEDLLIAAGFDDQRLYVSRSAGLVVARLAGGSVKWRDGEFWRLLSKGAGGLAGR
jgi:CubicO group peptidase (beta-lactamase class C family)